MQDSATLQRLIAARKPGFSLPQAFYVRQDVFDAEVDRFLAAHWIAAGHVSELPERGDFFVFEALNSSLIVTRGADGQIHALHNVCRHRGAKLCTESKGKASLLHCRYHGWSYRLNGELAAWRHMPEGLGKGDYSLRRCGVTVFHGIILVSLDPANAPDATALLQHIESRWQRFDLAHCKVAVTQSYRIAANWKLAIENNLECYHCLPSHPEYSSVNAFVSADERVTGAHVEQFNAYHLAWKARLEAQGIVTGRTGMLATRGQPSRAGTWPLAPGFLTGSRDGQGVAPLLGRIVAYDESVTTGCVGFLSYMAAMCDYALLVTYVPQSAGVTDVVLKWLVRADAREGVDYDCAKLRWLWDETTKQDKGIIELNAAGVATRGYVPGPYSTLEGMTVDFVERYLALMAPDA